MKFSAQFLFTFILFLLVASGFLLVAVSPVRAASPSPSNDSHLYTQQVLLDLSSALTCQLAGIDPSGPDPATGQPKRCLGYDVGGKLGFLPNPTSNGMGQAGGVVGLMGNFIAVLYTPPASTGDYFQYLANNFGIARPAYAQGIGFTGLAPLLPVWTIFRNIAYLFFVILFIVTGVAVMLRIKIDPRTVMSIQNQIPKLIITLILITFSYAIAGFFIDLMYLAIYLLVGLTSEAIKGINGANFDANLFQGRNPFEVANEMVKIITIISLPAGAVRELIGGLFKSGDVGGFLLGLVGGGIAFLVIAIAVLWALFRLWFELLKAYIFILVDVLFAPLWLLTGVIPGGMGAGSWLRDIISNLASFPTAIGMFLIGKILMETVGKGDSNTFVPPMIGNPNVAEGSEKLLAALIGLGIILLTPDVVNMVKKAIKAPVFPLAPIFRALGVGASAPGRLIGGGMNVAFGVQTDAEGHLIGKGGTLGKFMRSFGFAR